jgi:hypothetical protein
VREHRRHRSFGKNFIPFFAFFASFEHFLEPRLRSAFGPDPEVRLETSAAAACDYCSRRFAAL